MIRSSNWTSQPWLNVPIDAGNPNSIGYGLKAAWLMNSVGNRVFNQAQGDFAAPLAGTTKPTFNGSPYGTCLTFDGTSGYVGPLVAAGQLDFLVSTAVFTVTMRMRLATVSADAAYVMFGGDFSTNNKAVTLVFENRVSVSSPKALRMIIGRGPGSVISYQSGANAIGDTNWHHVAYTANLNSGASYVDGILLSAASNTSAFSPVGPLTAIPNIGATTTPGFFFNGQIEHMCIWNRVLSADEIGGLCADPYQIFASPVLPQIFGYSPAVRSLYTPATLSLGSGGPFFQTPVNG